MIDVDLRAKSKRQFDSINATSGVLVFLDPPVVALSTAVPATGAWAEVDLSAVIPEESIGIKAQIILNNASSGADRYFAIDKNGRENLNTLITYTASEISYLNSNQGDVEIGSDLIIEYFLSAADTIKIIIVGYWLPVVQV